jgi:transcription elongation GreA/GreB family factor
MVVLALKKELVEKLRQDLAAAERAHRATLAGATHEEAKPENDKDTRALEQTYLARGQAQRVEELRLAIARVESMPLRPSERGGGERVTLGALVSVKQEHDGTETTYWLAPEGGGAELTGGVHVVTPQSPLGRALVGKEAGDVVEATIGGKVKVFEVLKSRY